MKDLVISSCQSPTEDLIVGPWLKHVVLLPVSKWPNADKVKKKQNDLWSYLKSFGGKTWTPQQVPSIFSKGKFGIVGMYFFLAFENNYVIGWKRRVGGVNAEMHQCCLFHWWLNRSGSVWHSWNRQRGSWSISTTQRLRHVKTYKWVVLMPHWR